MFFYVVTGCNANPQIFVACLSYLRYDPHTTAGGRLTIVSLWHACLRHPAGNTSPRRGALYNIVRSCRFRPVARFRACPAAPTSAPPLAPDDASGSGGAPPGPRPRPRPMACAARSRSPKIVVSLRGRLGPRAPSPPLPHCVPKTFSVRPPTPPDTYTRSCDRTLPHPTTRARDNAQHRPWFWTPRATRLLGLSSTGVVYRAPFAQTYQHARAEGGDQVAGRGLSRKKRSLGSHIRYSTLRYNTQHAPLHSSPYRKFEFFLYNR